MARDYRNLVKKAANLLESMGIDVVFECNETNQFRFANNGAWYNNNHLNVIRVFSYEIEVQDNKSSFIHSYRVPIWQLSDAFFYQLWCTYIQEIKATLTKETWELFNKEMGEGELLIAAV